MQKINSQSDLRDAITLLENRQSLEINLLKEQLNHTYEALKPINIIKHTISQAIGSQDIKDNILNSAIGLTAGYFSKKLFGRISDNLSKGIFGTALVFGITNLVSNNPEMVKSLGQRFFAFIRNRRTARVIEIKENHPPLEFNGVTA